MSKLEVLVRFVPLGNNPLHDLIDDRLDAIARKYGGRSVDLGTWFGNANRPPIREIFYMVSRNTVKQLKAAFEREPGILSVLLCHRYGTGYIRIGDDPKLAAMSAGR